MPQPLDDPGEAAAAGQLSVRASASARTVLVARVVGLGATFAGSIALARALGPEGRGAHAFFVAVVVIAVTLVGLGMPVGGYVLRSRRGVAAHQLAANATWLAIGAAAVVAIMVAGLSAVVPFVPAALSAVPSWPIALFVAVSGFGLNAYQLQLALASGRALLGAFLSFGTYSVAAVGYIIVLATGLGLNAAIWVVAIAPLLAATATALARPSHSPFVFGRPSREILRWTVREGLRFYPGEIAAVLLLRVDVILLGTLASVSAVGVYVVAYQTAEPILVIASASQAAILALGRSADGLERGPTVARMVRETLVLASLVSVVGGVLAPFVLPLIYGVEYLAAVGPFIVLLPAVVALAAGRVAISELTRRNRLEATVLVAFVALGVNVLLNLVLIPSLLAMGAAVASLGAYSVQAGLACWLLVREGDLRWRWLVPGASDIVALAHGWRPSRRPEGSPEDRPADSPPTGE